jgi:hypothetical protein
VSGEIAAVTAKASPTVDDLLLIEDAADTNSKKSVAIGDLPGVGSSFVDDQFEVVDNTDGSKKVALEVSGVSTATTRVLSVPDADGTIELDGHSHVEADVTDLTHYDDTDADARIALHAADVDAHHTRYTDAEAIAAAQDDPDAIHDDVAGEIHAITAKGTPVAADEVVVEDSEASWVKKRVAIGDLRGVTDHGALSGLSDDDHALYLLISGDRAMTGNLEIAKADPVLLVAGSGGAWPSGDKYLIGADTTGVARFILSHLDSSAGGRRDRIHVVPWETGAGTEGDIYIYSGKGAPFLGSGDGFVALTWDESDSRWEFAARPYSAADGALLAVEGHTHTESALLAVEGHTHTESDVTDLDHTDPDAVHDNASGEIAAVTAKATPVVGDLLLIEDSEASNAKKRITLGDLPHGVERVIFTSSGTFSKASYPEARLARVTVVGGGGGGGGAPSTGASQFSAGGGGGAGGWAVEDILLSAMATSETVTIGAGGSGGNGVAGSAGGTTSFGAFLSATGGGGGNIMAAGALTALRLEYGATGGLGSDGDINGRGNESADMVRLSAGSAVGGGLSGAASILSAGAVRVLSANGNAGTLGAGGGGMRSGSSAGARTGGVGGAGIVIVDLYG